MTRAAGLLDHARSLRMTMWGERVAYIRASTGTELQLTARRAVAFVATGGGDEVTVDSKHVDWCVVAADLLDRNARFTPYPGDKIVTDGEGNSQTYLVGLVGGDEPWGPADSDGYELRIHTKLWSGA